MSRFWFFTVALALLLLGLIQCEFASSTPFKKIGLDLSGCEIEIDRDTHGGFHGDGERYIRVNCSAEADRIGETVKNWKPLPLSDQLERLMYSSSGYRLADSAGIPKVQNGYYLFIDKQATGSDRSDDGSLFGRGSFNFIIAIYDTDNQILHYYEMDT